MNSFDVVVDALCLESLLALPPLASPPSASRIRISGARPLCSRTSQSDQMAANTKRTPLRAPHRAHLKLFFRRDDDGKKKLDLNPPSNQKNEQQQEADSARDELAATSARDGPAFLELCDRLREQR